MEAAASSPSSATATSRIRNFCTLPVTVIGKASTNFQSFGISSAEMRPVRCFTSSSRYANQPAGSFLRVDSL
jgi:hypothetical protein